jgi:hypothetical protein
MIPKQIFFIWLGDEKPKYVDFAVNAFKEVNPDFKIDLIEWSINDVENPKDELLKKSVDEAIKLNRKDRKFVQSVANIYRYTLLKHYGGIYLDCDTFPVKPFDDELLNHTEFDVTISWGINSFITRDVFFIGSCNSEYLRTHPKNHVFLYPHTETWKYKQLRDKFFNCTLKYGEFYGDEHYYINHYHDFTWNPKNLRTPLCNKDV